MPNRTEQTYSSYRRHPAAVVLLPVALLCMLAATKLQANDGWSWRIYPDLYQTMGAFERAQYDRAVRHYRGGEEDLRHRRHEEAVASFQSAAGEWKKFRVLHGQSVDPGILAHAIFMEARSLHQSRQRNQALTVYTEVLDFFPDELWVAAPAIYFRGIAHIDNGDIREGLEDMKAMYDDPDYRLHPLAAGALRRLADNHWNNNEREQAVRYWREVDRIFHETNEQETQNARNRVIDHYIREQRYSSIVNWRLDDADRNDAEQRRNIANWAWHRAYHNFHHDWEKYSGGAAAQRAADVTAFATWFDEQESWYRETEDMWTYYRNTIYFINRYQEARRDEAAALIDKAAALTRNAELDDRTRDSRFNWLAQRAGEHRNMEKVGILLGMASDPQQALWTEHEILGHRMNDWAQAAERLEVLKQAESDHWRRRATWALADIYRTRLGRYEEAIQLYHELADPPETLWRIQNAYRRWGNTERALRTLSELVGMFPDHAARALYQQAEYHRHDGRDDMAIALYRRILAQPDWKQERESSLAHQRLEDVYGIDTGGGVIHED